MKPVYYDNALIYGRMQATVCTSEAMFVDECKRQGVHAGYWLGTEGSNACAHTIPDKGVAIVCINAPEGFDPVQIAGLLIHEAVHIFQAECECIGERAPSAEFEAYGIQRIAQGLLAEYARQVFGV